MFTHFRFRVVNHAGHDPIVHFDPPDNISFDHCSRRLIYYGSAFIKMYTEVDPADKEIDDYTDSDGCVHKKIILESLNPEYGDIEISPNAYFSIVGRVLN